MTSQQYVCKKKKKKKKICTLQLWYVTRSRGLSHMSTAFTNKLCEFFVSLSCTHPDSSDRLHRSHITQYHWGYCELQYRWGYYEGTLMLLWQPGGGTHIWKWRTSATKHLRCRGLSVTNCVKKGGLWVTKRTKIGGLSVKCIKNRGFQGQNGKKFLNISSKMSKFSKNRGSLGESW